MNVRLVTLALATLLGPVTGHAQASPTKNFREVPCPADAPAPADRCGYVTVPEVHAAPDGKHIELFVAVKHATAATKQPDPIIYLEGGPGAPGSFAAGVLGQVFPERDVIGIDQRGIGRSTPTLHCPQVTAVTRRQDLQTGAAMQRAFTQALTECGQNLKRAGIDLAAYRASESALDVDHVRRALSYDTINLYGSSYGTRLAQEVMRRTPRILRSVILDSVIPANVDRVAATPRAVNDALHRVFATCAADQACNRTYPNLRETYQQAFEKLNRNPLKVNITGTGGKLDGHAFQGLVLGSLYFSLSVAEVPSLIHAARSGNTRAIENTFAAKTAGFIADAVSWGAFYTHECQGEVAYSSRANLAAAYVSTPHWKEALGRIPGIASAGIFDVCQAWGLTTASAHENDPVTSSVPTLLIAGEFDPVTPPAWLTLASRTLTRAQTVVLTGQSHAVGLTSRCGVAMAQAFIHDPTAKLDTACATSTRMTFK